jgi:hypothetical protein
MGDCIGIWESQACSNSGHVAVDECKPTTFENETVGEVGCTVCLLSIVTWRVSRDPALEAINSFPKTATTHDASNSTATFVRQSIRVFLHAEPPLFLSLSNDQAISSALGIE